MPVNIQTIGDAYGLIGRNEITQTYVISIHEGRLIQFVDAY